MATQSKVNDPTEAALSAIEEALNLSSAQPPVRPEPPLGQAVAGPETDPLRLPDIRDSELFPEVRVDKGRDRAARGGRDPLLANPSPAPDGTRRPEPGRPANDDRRAVGEILQALQVRPSRTPYLLAFLASALWLGVFGSYAWSRWGAELSTDAMLAIRPETGLFAFAALSPVVICFVLALLYVRAQEMRLVARSMTQVAIRLAEPENAGSDAVISLSQAIRREVAAMGDGIERAVARAGELETLVHSEVATLERAYGENEIRIRALIDELVVQREAILSNADRVRASISGSHDNLKEELSAASLRIADAVGEAGARVT